MKARERVRAVVLFCAVCLGSRGLGQSFSVDLDFAGSSEEVGGGVPGAGFPGPADVPSVWNSVSPFTWDPVPLFDINGIKTDVQIVMSGSGGALGFNNSSISGDHKLLMADAEQVSDLLAYTFTGLRPGAYRVFTLALHPSGQFASTTINVLGSTNGPETVRGSLSGNFFRHLETHAVHDVIVTDGSLRIEARGAWPTSCINGFQVSEVVPEPTSISALSLALLFFLRRSRKM